MTKIAKKDFATRTRRIKAGMAVTDEMLADAAMSAEDLAARGFVEEAGDAPPSASPLPAGSVEASPGTGDTENGSAKPAKRR